MNKVLELSRGNEFFNDALEYIKGMLEYNDNINAWCYLRGDSSGRWEDPIPVNYITEKEQEEIIEELLTYGYKELDEYDWGEMSVDDVEYELYEENNLFWWLVEQLKNEND